MRNHTFQHISNGTVEKVSSKFEWPRDRPLNPKLDSNTAFINEQSLMMAGQLEQDPEELMKALHEERSKAAVSSKEKQRRTRSRATQARADLGNRAVTLGTRLVGVSLKVQKPPCNLHGIESLVGSG